MPAMISEAGSLSDFPWSAKRKKQWWNSSPRQSTWLGIVLAERYWVPNLTNVALKLSSTKVYTHTHARICTRTHRHPYILNALLLETNKFIFLVIWKFYSTSKEKIYLSSQRHLCYYFPYCLRRERFGTERGNSALQRIFGNVGRNFSLQWGQIPPGT